jgi:small-conductance mechanosensitive channel
MGQFNGEQLISTPIQLQDIKNKHSIGNYIQALRDSRVLYVNDKFMYKTNVVYTGVKINSISQIKQDEESAEVDFSIWFRYQGDFNPSQIEFLNGNVKLTKPEEKIDMENDHYVRFRTKGVFSMNFEKDKKSYGTNTINIIYRHKQFNQNNLLFVTDLLGMPTNKEMIEQMEERGVIDTTLGWNVTDFFVSQSLIKDLSEGKPQYIGYQGEDTLFSTMNVELKIESSMLKAKDFIDKKYFIYLLILALVGLIVARLMDSKRLGRYWYVHAFILRTLFLPIFVVSLGNIILDWAYVNADHITTSYLVVVYESLWWLVPAYLIDSAIRRFIWIPIHEKTLKKIPQIIVFFVSFLIYLLAISGILAFVFEKEITNILAASGVLVMIVGLAIKTNIANVFSGLILNMDKPFKVGELIEVDKLSGIVVDIGWRATKLKTLDGVYMLIPNEKISNAKTILNYSRGENFELSMDVYLKPDLNPDRVIPLMEEAVKNSNFILIPFKINNIIL